MAGLEVAEPPPPPKSKMGVEPPLFGIGVVSATLKGQTLRLFIYLFLLCGVDEPQPWAIEVVRPPLD
jgi:hypothetical protein